MFRNLNPRQKKILIAVGAGGLLALIAMLGRGRSSQQAASAGDLGATAVPAGSAALPGGSTFADNGEASAGLTSSLTGALGDIGFGQQAILDALGNLPTTGTLPQAPSATEIAAAVGPAVAASLADQGAISTPSGAQTAARTTALATRRAGVFTQTEGTRTGLQYIVQRGQRLYESAPGKGDWGKKPRTRIPVASKPPAARAPAPAAAAPARPSTPPAGTLPPGVFLQTQGTRAGRHYIVQGNYRRYESAAGRGDWGHGGVIPR